MPTTLHENRPSAGIGVVEVQKPMVFSDFQHARATLCGDRRGRGAKTHGFLRFPTCRATLCGDRRGRGAKTHGFLRFLRCSRNLLRGSAWSRCKNPWCFAISAVPAQPSAGIGVVEVQKLEVFCDFCGARATLCGNRRGRGAKTQGFLRLLLFELVLGTGGFRVRFLPGPRAGVARCNLHFKATCADQLAPTSLRRAPCLEQLAQSNLRRATCAEQLAQSSLHRATCRERNLHRATCREPLAGTNLPEQLARSNLRRATCTVQLA